MRMPIARSMLVALSLAVCCSAQLRMGHIHLNVSDVEAQTKFWVTQFDAVAIPGGVAVPGMQILFHRQPPTHPTLGIGLDHFGFKVHSRDDMVARAKAAGYEIGRVFKGSEGFPNAYLIGPDGIRVEVQEEEGQKERAIAQHLHYLRPDYWELRDWYIQTFGMLPSIRGPHISTDIPGINLTFAAARTPNNTPTRGGLIDHICFEAEQPGRWCQGAGSCFLTDPAGVLIEIVGYSKR